MRTSQIRAAIIPPLTEFLGVPVIESNQFGSVPKGPHFSFTFTTAGAAEGGASVTYESDEERLTKVYEQDGRTVLSLTSITNSEEEGGSAAAKDESVRLTDLAYEWFEFYGEEAIMSAGIAVVSLSTIAPRNGIDDEEYRRGFDITIRSRKRLTQDVDYFDTVVMTREV